MGDNYNNYIQLLYAIIIQAVVDISRARRLKSRGRPTVHRRQIMWDGAEALDWVRQRRGTFDFCVLSVGIRPEIAQAKIIEFVNHPKRSNEKYKKITVLEY